MKHISDHLSPAEYEQLRAADRRYRRNVWAVAVCGLAAFWTLVAAAIVGVR
jgi:hypothetical protein